MWQLRSTAARPRSRLLLALNAVLTSAVHSRWNTLRTQACKLGRLVGGGLLERSNVRDELLRTCRANGYVRDHGENETMRTIESGLTKGASRPIYAMTRGAVLEMDVHGRVVGGCAYPYAQTWNAIRELPDRVATSTDKLVLIEVILPPRDSPRLLRLLGEGLSSANAAGIRQPAHS